MISLILYGRNDSHGYNLHKRAALSLNCIAELLDDPDDEIIFIDYNSPDQIPTFPEAIADTLTPRTAELLRVIRVRSSYHKRFDGRTRLVALEPQSRNIAVRRSNPANRWILSTNTDMIFVPRPPHQSLSNIAAGLEDGFYHLPRFELPEFMWESLDRLRPSETIEQVAQWGKRFHLNEVVYAGYDNVYEAPGDFQLFLRDDLFRIGGFDESMILGWHVDSNIARRMKLLRGNVASAVDHLFGYHCGHTRQPTALHGAGFTSNSIDTYVRQVNDPVLHDQQDWWGEPDAVFEERRIGNAIRRRTLRLLEEAIAEGQSEIAEVRIDETSFDETDYHPDHVLPHLLNLMSELAPRETILMIGTDRKLLEGLSSALEVLDHGHRLIALDDWPELGAAFQTMSFAEAMQQASVILFQYPDSSASRLNDGPLNRWRCERLIEQVIAIEKTRAVTERRLILIVNGTHNRLQHSFMPHMALTAIPYTARLRQGYVIDPLPIRPAFSGLQADETGRMYNYSEDDWSLFASLISVKNEGTGFQRLALDIQDMLSNADDVPSELSKQITVDTNAIIRVATDRCAEPPIRTGPRTLYDTRLCSTGDWEDPNWFNQAMRYWGDWSLYDIRSRSRWTWERNSLLFTLRRRFKNSSMPWVLVITEAPDVLPAIVAHSGFRVAYATLEELTGRGKEVADWDRALASTHFSIHEDLIPLRDRISRIAAGEDEFEAVVIGDTLLFSKGWNGTLKIWKRLASLCVEDAFVVASTQVHLNNMGLIGALTFADWCRLDAEESPLEAVGFKLKGASDHRIPLDCAVRFAPEDSVDLVSGLSFGWNGSFLTVGIVAMEITTPRKSSVIYEQIRQVAEDVDNIGPSSVIHAEPESFLFESLPKNVYQSSIIYAHREQILPGDQAAMTSNGDLETRRKANGCFFYGPYIDLPGGDYRFEMNLRRGLLWFWRKTKIEIEVVDCETVIHRQTLNFARWRKKFCICFAIPESEQPCSIETRVFVHSWTTVRLTEYYLIRSDKEYESEV